MHYIFSLSWPYCKRSLFPHCQRKYACSAAKVSVCVCTSETHRGRERYTAIYFLYIWISEFCILERCEKLTRKMARIIFSHTPASAPGTRPSREIFLFLFVCIRHMRIGGLMKLCWSNMDYIS